VFAYRRSGNTASSRRLLGLSEGYRAESTAGRIGTVERVLRRRSTGEPYALAIRAGLYVTRLVVVPASFVTAVDGGRRCVVLEAGVLEAPRLPRWSGASPVTGPRRAVELAAAG
jgi:hypothetical protein